MFLYRERNSCVINIYEKDEQWIKMKERSEAKETG